MSYQSDVFDGADYDEQLTFQDFVSTIVNSEDKQSHLLIIQDIARLLELKLREFKKNLLHHTQNSVGKNLKSLYLDTQCDLFTRIAEKLFKMACEEPNGILGTRIKLSLALDNAATVDVCDFFAYDSKTFATSEITVILKEDVTKLKKFVLACGKVFSLGVDRFVALKVDSVNFEIAKKKLY